MRAGPPTLGLILLALLSPAKTQARLAPRLGEVASRSASRVGEAAGRSARRAAEAGGELTARAGRKVVSVIDSDGDGDISVEELEVAAGRFRRWCGRISRCLQRTWRRNRHLGLLLTGLLGLVHGGSFAYTILFAQTFAATGWPLMRSGVRRAAAAYDRAKAVPMAETRDSDPWRRGGGGGRVGHLREQLRELGAEAARLQREGASRDELAAVVERMRRVRAQLDALPSGGGGGRRAGPVLALMMLREPMVFRDLALGVWSGLSVSMAAAANGAARAVGLGATIGEALAALLELLAGRIELWARQLSSSLPAGATAAAYMGPSNALRAAVWFGGRGLGCALALKLQGAAMSLSVSLLAARAVLGGLAGLSGQAQLARRRRRQGGGGGEEEEEEGDEEGDEEGGVSGVATSSQAQLTMMWLLAAAGMHARGRLPLPLAVRVVLLPAYAVEAALRGVALKLTSDDFQKVQRDAGRSAAPDLLKILRGGSTEYELSVRPGRRDDLEQLVALTCDLAEETEHGLQLDRAKVTAGVEAGLPAASPAGGGLQPRYWVAERDGRLVGFVSVSPEWSDWWACAYWWIMSVFVQSSERRTGVASALFSAMYEDAERDGVQTINLRVERANQHAQSFYAKLGFLVDESHLVMARGRRPDGSVIGES